MRSAKPRSRIKASTRRFLKTSEIFSNSELRFNYKARFVNALRLFKLNNKHWRAWCNSNLRGAGVLDLVNVKKLETKVASMVINRHWKAYNFPPDRFMFNHKGELVQE